MPGQHWEDRGGRGRAAFLLVLDGMDSRTAFRVAAGNRFRKRVSGNGFPENWKRVSAPLLVGFHFLRSLYFSSSIYGCRGAAAAAEGRLVSPKFPEEIRFSMGDVMTASEGGDRAETCCECPEPAVVFCFGCNRPLCEGHRLVEVYGRAPDQLDVAVCAECAPAARAFMG